MTKKFLLIGTAMLCLAAGIFASAGGAKNSNANPPNVNAAVGDTLTLSATDSICWADSCSNWTNFNPGDPSKCIGGGYWSRTYNGSAKPLTMGDFSVSHNAGIDSFSYWGGLTTGSNGDNLCYTLNCKSNLASCAGAGSSAWIYNQWGVMAGGGLTTPPTTVPGQPYLIAFWNFYTDGDKSIEVSLKDGSLFAPQEVYICNHPWPFYGNIYGDGFARPLNQPGDRFDLVIHALDADGVSIDTIKYVLAQYDPTATDSVRQSSNWQRVDLTTKKWDDIGSLSFTMSSTDSTQYGMNTAAYFNMDKLKVIKGDKPSKKAVVKKTTTAKPPVVVTDYFPITSYTGGDVLVYNTEGKEVWRTVVGAGEKPNLSELPKGEYRLRHGHRVIPIKKLK